jgi:hypothetical protein
VVGNRITGVVRVVMAFRLVVVTFRLVVVTIAFTVLVTTGFVVTTDETLKCISMEIQKRPGD